MAKKWYYTNVDYKWQITVNFSNFVLCKTQDFIQNFFSRNQNQYFIYNFNDVPDKKPVKKCEKIDF